MKTRFTIIALCLATLVGCASKETTVTVQYLEIVTPDVDATITALTSAGGLTFGEPVEGFGNARIAERPDGQMIGVRAPMAEHETPIVRPYLLVDDLQAALKKAEAAGGQIAYTGEIPGYGQCAIYLLGGINHGLWQN